MRFTCSTKALLRLTEPSAALWASANVEWQSRDQLPAVANWLARKRGVVRRLTLSSRKADGQLDSPAACGFMLGCLAGAPLESLSLGCALDLSSTLLLDLPGLQRLEVEPRGGPSQVNLSDGLAHLTSLTRLHLGDLGTCSSLDECVLPAALRALSVNGMYGPEGLAAVEAVAPQLHELHLSWDGVSEGADTGAAGFLARASTCLTALTGLSLNYELAALGGTLRALDLIDNPRLEDAHSVLADLARLTWLSLRGCGFAAVPAGVWRLQELQASLDPGSGCWHGCALFAAERCTAVGVAGPCSSIAPRSGIMHDVLLCRCWMCQTTSCRSCCRPSPALRRARRRALPRLRSGPCRP